MQAAASSKYSEFSLTTGTRTRTTRTIKSDDISYKFVFTVLNQNYVLIKLNTERQKPTYLDKILNVSIDFALNSFVLIDTTEIINLPQP